LGPALSSARTSLNSATELRLTSSGRAAIVGGLVMLFARI